MKKGIKEEIFNIPNTITLVRISLIPVSLLFLWMDTPSGCFFSALTFAVASATDFVDGWVARRFNLITITGKFLDPLADKLIVISTLIMLITLNRVPAWLVIIIVARELSITALRALAAGEGMVMAAGQEGKWKTALQLVGIVGLIVYFPYTINFGLFEIRFPFFKGGLFFLYASVFFSLLSAGKYFVWFANEAERRDRELKNARV